MRQCSFIKVIGFVSLATKSRIVKNQPDGLLSRIHAEDPGHVETLIVLNSQPRVSAIMHLRFVRLLSNTRRGL